jgi:IS605 OrfB family transposase
MHGNLLNHNYESEQRIQFAGQNKRDNDVRLLAKRVVDKAVQCRKPLVLEQLSFKKKDKKRGTRKFRRMKHNFIHRKMLDAIKARADKQGVEVLEVDPAFTSVLGNLKYKSMYSLNRHTAAGLVIARRGMGLLERMDFKVRPESSKSGKLNLEGRGLTVILTAKACSYLLSSWVKVKKPGLTGPPLAPCSHGIDGSVGGIPTRESVPITGRDGVDDEIPMGW